MKTRIFASTILAAAALFAASCVDDKTAAGFDIDTDTFTVDEFGGNCQIRITSDTEWIATSDDPWLTISPANGRGSANCKIIVDSTLYNTTRTGHVRITQQNESLTQREITIEQKGFDYEIVLLNLENNKDEVEIANYANFGERYFDLTVQTNVDFDIDMPDVNWLSYESYNVSNKLDRGVRPREVKIRFNWGINSVPEERKLQINFKPKNGVSMSRNDILTVRQSAAEPIEEGTRRGDSVALLGAYRSLGVWSGQWDTSKPMDQWSGVSLWREGQKNYTEDKKGRVRSVYFYLFETKEGLPYEIQYLTALESLRLMGNINSFLLSVDTGEYLSKLTQLKRLDISGYGFSTLPDSFANLHNLEFLALAANNFQSIPSVITPENFPNLHSLVLNANRRSEFNDLSNIVIPDYGNGATGLGGLIDEKDVLERLFKFEKLDTLILGINYLHGSIPTFDTPEYESNPEFTWTKENADTLATQMTSYKLWDPSSYSELTGGKRIPRVLPNLRWFTINGNRFTGELPLWLLYHPRLDEWVPFQLVFAQEGRTLDGAQAGFDNEPANLEYYYDFYEGAKVRPSYDYYPED